MVRIDDPPSMNLLGLCLASALRANLDGPCPLRGTLLVDADGMRVFLRFEADGVTVTRAEAPARTRISGSLAALVSALVRPGLGTLFKIKVRGSRLFALRAMRVMAP